MSETPKPAVESKPAGEDWMYGDDVIYDEMSARVTRIFSDSVEVEWHVAGGTRFAETLFRNVTHLCNACLEPAPQGTRGGGGDWLCAVCVEDA
jgi:hypothetical protein